MIRRDYLLRMIEEFIQAMARIHSFKQAQLWNETSEAIAAEVKRLLGDDLHRVAQLSETELLTRLMQDGPTQVVRDKTLMLTTLLREAGDVAVAENPEAESCACYLKALHLLLNILAREGASDCPEFVPKVGMLRAALQGTPLPFGTQMMLMQHYERTGEFARAEDALFALIEAEPGNDRLLEFGMAFYQRLLQQSDDALSLGELPRAEVEQAVKELQARLNANR